MKPRQYILTLDDVFLDEYVGGCFRLKCVSTAVRPQADESVGWSSGVWDESYTNAEGLCT